MSRFERICPECGTGNAFHRTQCRRCGAPLTGVVNSAQPAPAALSRRGLVKLAWRATKFLTRTGFHLARQGAKHGIETIQKRNVQDVKNETVDAEYRLRDWRAWSSKPGSPPEETEGLHWGKKQ